jgi:hypothetical protein
LGAQLIQLPPSTFSVYATPKSTPSEARSTATSTMSSGWPLSLTAPVTVNARRSVGGGGPPVVVVMRQGAGA